VSSSETTQAFGDPDLVGARNALQAGDLRTAERSVRAVLERRPNDSDALQMLGEIAARAGALRDAEALYRRALEFAPSFDPARFSLAQALYQQSQPAAALAELDRIEGRFASHPDIKALRAALLAQLGEYHRAIDLYREIVAAEPGKLQAWTGLAFLFKTIGEPSQAVEACHNALKVAPASGKLWWMLANLKTYPFSKSEIARLEALIADPNIPDEDRLRFHMTLGKALEDDGELDRSFDHYRKGNAIRSAQVVYEPERMEELIDRQERLFTADFFGSRAGNGDPAPDPIFILGNPRSGSTLLEQILASHPMIEGTAELTEMHVLAKGLVSGTGAGAYPEILADLTPARLAELGHQYLERTRVHRKTDRPLFIDKMPNNWLHIGFITLILPNAKIIDARRHPLACGLSNFKQLYARGNQFSYDLDHFGQHYRQYLRSLNHFHRVAPGRVLTVIHESVVADPEQQIRRMLDYVGVPFDEACLRFHENRRPVRSASAEQVRRPLQPETADRWRDFEAHLGPLKDALGPALEHWHETPET
jgi:Tfp pilus assembly protein PilF